MASSSNHYPRVSDIIELSILPDKLSFVKDAIHNITDDIFYKDYFISKSIHGDTGNTHEKTG